MDKELSRQLWQHFKKGNHDFGRPNQCNIYCLYKEDKEEVFKVIQAMEVLWKLKFLGE